MYVWMSCWCELRFLWDSFDLNVIDSGGSKKRDAVMVEGGSKRIDVINVESEEESTTRNSKDRKQSGGNNGKPCN